MRPNLILTIPGKDESLSRIWIMSHLDVVPPGEMGLWKSDPWGVVKAEGGSRSDGSPLGKRLVGRGVEDNQQGLVSSVLAALALVKRGVIPHRTVKLLFAADEEMGSSYGIGWLIRNHRELFRQTDMALIPDGGDSRGASIEVAEKHLIWARFTLRGRQSHGSRPDLGINAHLAGADLALKLHYGLSEKFSARDPLFEPNYSTFQPTKREANVPNINTIPGEDVFCMDMRVLPRYSAREVFAEIDRIKGEIEKRYGVVVTYSTPQCMESRPTAVDAPLIRILSGPSGAA